MAASDRSMAITHRQCRIIMQLLEYLISLAKGWRRALCVVIAGGVVDTRRASTRIYGHLEAMRSSTGCRTAGQNGWMLERLY